MSLQNGLIHAQAGYLWTDTAALDPKTGRVTGHVPKALIGEAWPWAAIYSGIIIPDDPGMLARLLVRMNPLTPDELLPAAVQALREYEPASENTGRLLVCCACPRTGPRLWFISTDETPHSRPFVPEEFLQFMSSGNGVTPPAGIDLDNLTPEGMRDFIDWQVPLPTRTVCGLHQPTIGGNIIQLRITAAGVEQNIVRKMVGISATPPASDE